MDLASHFCSPACGAVSSSMEKIDDETFRKAVLMLLLVAGLSLIVPALIFRVPDTGLAGMLSSD